MKVRIVCYEDVDKWILGKFALKLQENLLKLGIECDIAKKPDIHADINHHIIYLDYNGISSGIDTLMITHIDDISKKNMLLKNLQIAQMGICMSNESVENLVNLGIPRKKLSYVNPAHDNVMIPRPKIVGITSRVQEDGRKREKFLSKLSKEISPKYFSFKIMGDGWDKQVEDLRKSGFTVEYTKQFIYSEYTKLIPSLDYYLYMGMDEGQMGFIDALAAGVETIVTSQGYHLDASNGITYPFTTYEELLAIFQEITKKRETLINSVSKWKWEDYTKKHLEIWEYCIAAKNKKSYLYTNPQYHDGINSVYEFAENKGLHYSNINRIKLTFTLFTGKIKHHYYIYKNILKRNGIKKTIQKGITKLTS